MSHAGTNLVSEYSVQNHFTGLSRLKLFWALSRTPHGLLDMCTPAFGALLWLGHFPSIYLIIIGLVTTFAGYTAVYALNDVIDYKVDKEKAATKGFSDSGSDLDSVWVRHPMAQGLLSFKEGLFLGSGMGPVGAGRCIYIKSGLCTHICEWLCPGDHILPIVARQPVSHICQRSGEDIRRDRGHICGRSESIGDVFNPAFFVIVLLGGRRSECSERLGRCGR